MKTIRQGDILLVATKRKEQRGKFLDEYIIEKGKHHVHLVTAVILLSSGVFSTTENSRLLHLTIDGKLAEHAPIELPANLTFLIKKQVGYSYFSETSKIQRIKD